MGLSQEKKASSGNILYTRTEGPSNWRPDRSRYATRQHVSIKTSLDQRNLMHKTTEERAVGIRIVRERFPPQRRPPKDGDWICDACHNINFNWRYVCNAHFCKGEWTESCRAYVAGRGYVRATDPPVPQPALTTPHVSTSS